MTLTLYFNIFNLYLTIVLCRRHNDPYQYLCAQLLAVYTLFKCKVPYSRFDYASFMCHQVPNESVFFIWEVYLVRMLFNLKSGFVCRFEVAVYKKG